jgi:hypothetical protein
MSPGAIFERVYNELKRMLAEGELPPGSPIEPALIGKQIASSITPIRDALHRLTGERLVEAPNHNGFRVPILSEGGLRDLYNWNAQLLSLATRRIRAPLPTNARSEAEFEKVGVATASLFVEIVRVAGSAEHLRAIQRLGDRIAPYRRVETQFFDDVAAEFDLLRITFLAGNRKRLSMQLAYYHRRRISVVPELLATLRFDG